MRLLTTRIGSVISKLVPRFSGIFLVVIVLGVYLLTLAPGVWGFDSAELATGAYTLGLVHPPGYPLYLLIAKLFTLILPIKDVAYRLNILSAIFAILTIYFLFDVLLCLTKNRLVAWLSAAFFAFSNYFWQMGLIAEVYTLHTFLLILSLDILLRLFDTKQEGWLYLFAFVYGLSLCNHTSGVLFSLGFGWLLLTHGYFKANWLKRTILLAVCFLLGLLPYLYFPIRDHAQQIINYPQQYYGIDIGTLQGFWWMVSGKAYNFFKFAYEWNELPSEVARYANFLWRNFLGIGVLLGLIGLISMFRKQWKWSVALLLLFLANVIFYINYRVVDKDTMFLPSYLVFTVFIAFGMYSLWQYLARLIQAATQKRVLNGLVIFFFTMIPISALLVNWRWVDMRKMDSPERFAYQVFLNTPEEAMIFADWSSAVVLEYFQVVQEQRQDLIIYNRSRTSVAIYYRNWDDGMPHQENLDRILEYELGLIDANLDQRPVYMTEYDADISAHFRYIPEGSYFKLERKLP